MSAIKFTCSSIKTVVNFECGCWVESTSIKDFPQGAKVVSCREHCSEVAKEAALVAAAASFGAHSR